MDIRGLARFSLIDYPEKIACIVFTAGCNFRCPYCHNPHLVFDPESQPHITEDEFFAFLEKRRGKLDAVVISGGEPTMRSKLPDFAQQIKSMGFLVKLDTNGSCPKTVKKMYKNSCLDALGIDFKAPAERYHEISKHHDKDLPETIKETIRFALQEELMLDIRTTIHKSLFSMDDLQRIRYELDEIGVDEWVLQQFHPTDIIDDSLHEEDTYSDFELKAIAQQVGGNTKVRGLRGKLVH